MAYKTLRQRLSESIKKNGRGVVRDDKYYEELMFMSMSLYEKMLVVEKDEKLGDLWKARKQLQYMEALFLGVASLVVRAQNRIMELKEGYSIK